MLGLFVILMCVIVGKCVYALSACVLKKVRGDNGTNRTISVILAILLAVGVAQWLIGCCH